MALRPGKGRLSVNSCTVAHPRESGIVLATPRTEVRVSGAFGGTLRRFFFQE